MTTTNVSLLVLLGLFAFYFTLVLYLYIGIRIGMIGWDIWENGKRGLLSFLFFPVSYIDSEGDFHKKEEYTPPPGYPVDDGKGKDRRGYIRALAILWPLKILLNCVTIPLCVAIALTSGIFRLIIPSTEHMRSENRVRVERSSETKRERYEKLLEERERLYVELQSKDEELDRLESEMSQEEGAKVYRLQGRAK